VGAEFNLRGWFAASVIFASGRSIGNAGHRA
jgi:hypothetical protein